MLAFAVRCWSAGECTHRRESARPKGALNENSSDFEENPALIGGCWCGWEVPEMGVGVLESGRGGGV